MYVLGGVADVDGKERAVSSVLRFDSRAQTWSEVAPMPAERCYAGACVVGSAIYIFGGRDDIEELTYASTTYRYSTETNTWTTLSPIPVAKCAHRVCVLDGHIYLIGGEDSDETPLSSVHRFDPVANLWSVVSPMSVARSELGAFVMGGSIYAVGGWDGDSKLTSMERYCVALDSWSDVSSGELSTARVALGALLMRLDVNFFDCLMAKAKLARQ
jgi:hypothetical protein